MRGREGAQANLSGMPRVPRIAGSSSDDKKRRTTSAPSQSPRRAPRRDVHLAGARRAPPVCASGGRRARARVHARSPARRGLVRGARRGPPRASPASSRFSHDEAAVARGDPTWAILTPVISDQVSIPDGVVGDVVEIGCEVGDVVEEGHVSVIIETHKGTNAERDARADAMAIRVILERGSRETARSFRSPPSPTGNIVEPSLDGGSVLPPTHPPPRALTRRRLKPLPADVPPPLPSPPSSSQRAST